MPQPALTIARFTFIEALRNRLVWLLVACVGTGLLGAEFTAQVVLTEAAAFQSALLGAYLRLSAVFLVAAFVVTGMVRELNDKGFEMLLALPITRGAYLAGKLLGFALLATLVAGIFALALLPYAAPLQVVYWGTSLACELALTTALAMLCLFTLPQVPAALAAVLAFYLLARSMAAFQLMAHGPMRVDDGAGAHMLTWAIDAIAFVLPALDRFTRSSWLMYGDGSLAEVGLVLGQTGIYLMLLVAAAAFDLYRKNL